MSKIVLLVIDVQELITNEKLFAFDKFTLNVNKLITECRSFGIEIIYVRHDDGEGYPLSKKNKGYDIYNAFYPEEGERIFDKTVNSPFRESGLLEYLHSIGADTLIVTGLQTEFCIDATIKCGFEHGFEMIVPEYCNTTVDNDYMSASSTYHYYNDFIWKNRYARCVSISETVDIIRRR